MNLIEITDLINIQMDDIGNQIPLRLKILQINAIQSYLHNLIINSESDMTSATVTITPVADGVELPVDFLRVRDVSTNGIPIEIIQPQQRHSFEGTMTDWESGNCGAYFAYFRGNRIFFYTGLIGGNDITFTYTRRLPKLHRGRPTAATSTTVTLAEYPLIGTVSTKNDYYKNATIIGLIGPGAGEEHVFTGYVGSTRVGTTDEWDETLTTDSVYEIKCELPEDPDFHITLCDIVSNKLGKDKGDRQVWDDLDMKLSQLSSRNSQNAWIIL